MNPARAIGRLARIVAALATAVLAVTASGGNFSPTVWATPIRTATNSPGAPISVGTTNLSPAGGSGQIAITPDGKTAYVATASGVTPISTATNKAGTPIQIADLTQIAITPDGKTVYVATASDAIIPINTATNTRGQPIHIFTRFNPAIAITP